MHDGKTLVLKEIDAFRSMVRKLAATKSKVIGVMDLFHAVHIIK